MKYVALLRGINVGGNNKVPMAELKDCFERLAFVNVSTYINSGNVIFETGLNSEIALVTKIEKGIRETFGLSVRVLVRSQSNLKKVARAIPATWQNDSQQKSDVLFLWDDYADEKSLQLIKARSGVDRLIYVAGAILWNVQKRDYRRSGMSKFIGTELYKNMTARNVNTTRKLAELMLEK